MFEETSAVASTVCALAECQVEVQQPARGGRKRLYCSDAHRAEAGRRRQSGTAAAGPVDVFDSLLDQLEGVLGGLRRQHERLSAIDPARQASDAARIRAEATAEVLAAQQATAAAAEEAARVNDILVAERASWNEQRQRIQVELDDLGRTAATARQSAAMAQGRLDDALGTHQAELDRRDRAAAVEANRFAEELRGQAQDLERAQLAAAAAQARADAADHRAASAEALAREASEEARRSNDDARRLDMDLERARGAAELAAARAETAVAALDDARRELAAERRRRDLDAGQLREQLAQLIAAAAHPAPTRKPPPRKPATRKTSHNPKSPDNGASTTKKEAAADS